MDPHQGATVYQWAGMAEERLTEKLSRKIVTGQQLMVTHVYLRAGCIVPRHSHENEQMSYVLSGALRFRVGDEDAPEVVVRAGEILHIPPGVPHGAVAIEESLSVDVFSPPRQDWLDGTDSYLREPAVSLDPSASAE